MGLHEEVMVRLAELRLLVDRKDNRFICSSWQSTDEALAKFDEIVMSRNTDKVLFMLAPTASLQELSIDSGWGDEFCRLAAELEYLLKA